MEIENDSLARLAHAHGMTDLEFEEREAVLADLAQQQVIRRRMEEEARRDEWCEGAGIPSIDEFPPLSAEDLAAIERDEAEVARRVAEAREREANTDFSILTDEEMGGDW
tara:strand:- start:861 stop:1190 length:330 start_codon:yes stop_codon:yes gene_type:complete